MIASMFPFLDAFYPACAAVGPFLLVMGIRFRTCTLRERYPKITNALLIVGGAMITFALLLNTPMGGR